MTLRSDIHTALDQVTPPAPHLPSVVVDAVLAAPAPQRRWPRAVGLFAAGAAGLLVIVAVVLSIWSSAVPSSTGPAVQPSSGPAALVITTWVKDPSVVSGPWPGYRPQISMMNRGTFASVDAARDPAGSDWVVQYTFEPEDARGFEQLTTAAAAACSGDCRERHLTFWLDLTPDDIAHWNERADVLSRQVSDGGKLLGDPYIQSPITSGRGYVQGNFSQQEATALARRLRGR